MPVSRERPHDDGARRNTGRDHLILDDAIGQRLTAMTTDFRKLWDDPDTPRRERKRLLAYIIEDATLIKIPSEGITKIHVRFKGGKTETLTKMNPRSSSQKVKTPPQIVELVDKLLDDHIYSEIADILNKQGLRPGGSARRVQSDALFADLRVAYLVHHYNLRSRYDRLRECGILTKIEAAARLGIHESTLLRWAECGLVTRHAYNAQKDRSRVSLHTAAPANRFLSARRRHRSQAGSSFAV